MKYLTLQNVLQIHDEMIEKYGGLKGVRDMNLIESAIEMPKARAFGEDLHPTIHDKAAAYLYHIAKNHPFFDANKRTSAACALIFLAMNDHDLNISPNSYEELVIEVAKGNVNKKQIADFFKSGLPNVE